MDTPRPATPAEPGGDGGRGGPGLLPPWLARQRRTALLAVADDLQQAGRALASGADLIDVSSMGAAERAAIRAQYPGAQLWAGPAADPVGAGPAVPGGADASAPAGPSGTSAPGVPGRPSGPSVNLLDADRVAATAGHSGDDAAVAAVVAAAAVGTWLGVAIIRTRHVAAVRLAIDMTSAIAGTRPPALTIRGLA